MTYLLAVNIVPCTQLSTSNAFDSVNYTRKKPSLSLEKIGFLYLGYLKLSDYLLTKLM